MDPLLSISTKAASVPPPPLVSPESEAASLRRKVEALERENQALKGEVATLKKRGASSPASGASAPKKARTAGQRRKLFQKWANALVRESRKHKQHYDMFSPDAYTITIKETTKWTPEDFHALFDGHGELIQPTPENKPKAVVTIRRFGRYTDVKRFFSDVGDVDIQEKGYAVQLWGKMPYGHSYQYDTAEARMHEMEVHYNKTRQTLSLVFSLVYAGLFNAADNW